MRRGRLPRSPAALPPLATDLPRNRLGLARWLVDPQHPLAGKVLDLAIVPGEYRTDQTVPVMTIADLSTVWVPGTRCVRRC